MFKLLSIFKKKTHLSFKKTNSIIDKSKQDNQKINGMISLQQEIINKKLEREKLISKLARRRKKISWDDRYITSTGRSYNIYNYIFKNILSSSKKIKLEPDIILNLLSILKKTKKKKISVLDDGAGEGFFLTQLKTKWSDLITNGQTKVILETTAVSLTDILTENAKKSIDRKKIEDTSFLLLDKKYDFIVSVYGGFNYSLQEIRKEIFLKYIYSLNREGIGVFGFSKKHVVLNERLERGIVSSLEKRGFQAEFVFAERNIASNVNLPNNYLIVKRIK